MSDSSKKKKPQIDKFKEAAHELETDQSEEAFDRIVKGIAKPRDDGENAGKRASRTKKPR